IRIIDGERAWRGRGAPVDVLLARPDRPSRCTLPITALRVMPPSSAAIWLAERPSDHNFLRCSTRSSVQDMGPLHEMTLSEVGSCRTESPLSAWQPCWPPLRTRITQHQL